MKYGPQSRAILRYFLASDLAEVSLDDYAKLKGVAYGTIRVRLANEYTSYQELLNVVRMDRLAKAVQGGRYLIRHMEGPLGLTQQGVSRFCRRVLGIPFRLAVLRSTQFEQPKLSEL